MRPARGRTIVDSAPSLMYEAWSSEFLQLATSVLGSSPPRHCQPGRSVATDGKEDIKIAISLGGRASERVVVG